ncbi:MAG: hypothetical protein IMZ44_07470 [Planctomycetes bacterium]|nr:hypothetical protein [Planctomycetota bacterium]
MRPIRVVVLLATASAIILACLYVPWVYRYAGGPHLMELSPRYEWIFIQTKYTEDFVAEIDTPLLAIELIIVSTVGGVAFALAGNRRRTWSGETSKTVVQ